MARTGTAAASAATRRAPWIWIAAAALVAVAALVLVYLSASGPAGGDRVSGGGVSFSAPQDWTAGPAPEDGKAAWVFARPADEGEATDAGAGYATLSVVVRDLPGGLSARGFADEHGGAATPRPAAGTTAWEGARLDLGVYERAAFVPLPDGASVAVVRLVAGPVPDWKRMEPAAAEASLAQAVAAYDALVGSLEPAP